MEAQIAIKTLFLGMSKVVFLEEISIWLSLLSEEGHPSHRPVHRLLNRTEGRGKVNSLSSELGQSSYSQT
jgi:hypothetical protein